MTRTRLFCFGLGYSALVLARRLAAAGWVVAGTCRSLEKAAALAEAGIQADLFDRDRPLARKTLCGVTHLLVSVPPDSVGDPVLDRYAGDIAAAPALRWLGYLSTTGVYGDRGGGWVDETSVPAADSDRARRRLAAEQAWTAIAGARPLDVFRLAGIYGPGRSPFDDLRAGRARRIDKPGHVFGRIHRDDIVAAVLAAMAQDRAARLTNLQPRILHLCDDAQTEPATVIAEAARLLGMPPPPLTPFEDAWATMSPMARSFWAADRKVDSRATKAALGIA